MFCLHVNKCSACTQWPRGPGKGVGSPWKWELQVVVSCYMDTENWTWVLCENSKFLLPLSNISCSWIFPYILCNDHLFVPKLITHSTLNHCICQLLTEAFFNNKYLLLSFGERAASQARGWHLPAPHRSAKQVLKFYMEDTCCARLRKHVSVARRMFLSKLGTHINSSRW